MRKAYNSLQTEIACLEETLEQKREKAHLLAQFLGEKPARRRGRRKGGGLTIEQGIIEVIHNSSGPLSTDQIVTSLAQLGVDAARTSVYGSISRLKQRGALASVNHDGRGDAYVPGKKNSEKKNSSRKKR